MNKYLNESGCELLLFSVAYTKEGNKTQSTLLFKMNLPSIVTESKCLHHGHGCRDSCGQLVKTNF